MTHSGLLVFLSALLLLLLDTPVRASLKSIGVKEIPDESTGNQQHFDDEYDEAIPVDRRSSRLGKRIYITSKEGILTSSRLG